MDLENKTYAFLELIVFKKLLATDYQGFAEITFFQKMLFLTLFGQNA